MKETTKMLMHKKAKENQEKMTDWWCWRTVCQWHILSAE